MLFLCKATIRKYEYLEDSQDYSKSHLVDASDCDEAKEKVERYYKEKGSDYGTSYSVLDTELSEIIT